MSHAHKPPFATFGALAFERGKYHVISMVCLVGFVVLKFPSRPKNSIYNITIPKLSHASKSFAYFI
jgi:hypothetical protein